MGEDESSISEPLIRVSGIVGASFPRGRIIFTTTNPSEDNDPFILTQ